MILLDTHVLVRYMSGDEKVGKRAVSALERALASDLLFVSALSFWEITMLVARRRIALATTVSAFRTSVLRHGILERAVDGEIAIDAGELPATHGDPADRLIVATAMVGGLTLVTADAVLLAWRLRGFRTQDATE